MRPGTHVPVTVLSLEGCQVTAQRTQDKDGYVALQLGAGAKKPKNTSKAERGHFAKALVEPKRCVAEFRVSRGQPDRRRRGVHRRPFPARPEGRRRRHDRRQGLRRGHQALEFRRHARHPRGFGVPPRPRLDRPAPGPGQGLQGQEDGRPHGPGQRHHPQPDRVPRRCGARSYSYQGRRSRHRGRPS